MEKTSDITIIGGGILGISIAYFLSSVIKNKSILVIDQAPSVAYHTSSRNTGKVHAPFLYDPEKKKLFAKAASMGFEMWETYAKIKNLPFKRDGVLEVATDEKGIERLEKYKRWGEINGLKKDELQLLDDTEVSKMEPEVKCKKAIYCTKDGSVDYGSFAKALANDTKANGATILLDTKVTKLSNNGNFIKIDTLNHDTIKTKFLINAAGGQAIDIAHQADVAKDLTDIHFRGEYWEAGVEYKDLTKVSVYSVPKHSQYPFLDPHWIVRVDGRREIGPNAVPVTSPYAYDFSSNLKSLFPKIKEMLGSGARKIIFDPQFLSLASEEFLSSLSKTVMINRVREFLPKIKPSAFKKRGTAGIRSSVVNENGAFVPDAILKEGQMSFHILNYNSPGATGALPFSVYVIKQMHEKGILQIDDTRSKCGPWNFYDIAENITM